MAVCCVIQPYIRHLISVNLKKGGLITGGAMLGTLLLGPIGLAIGGVVGK